DGRAIAHAGMRVGEDGYNVLVLLLPTDGSERLCLTEALDRSAWDAVPPAWSRRRRVGAVRRSRSWHLSALPCARKGWRAAASHRQRTPDGQGGPGRGGDGRARVHRDRTLD